MSDKVIHEIRFVETDDGFRIEVKGDKERMREMGWDPGMAFGPGFGFGPGMRFWRRMWRGPRPHRKHRHRHGFGPWAWWGWMDDEEEESEEPPQKA